MDILPFVLIAVGLLITSYAIWQFVAPSGWARAQGVVTGAPTRPSRLVPHRGSSFRFTAEDGTEHSVWSPDGTASGPTVGRAVPVRYDPADPTRARVSSSPAQLFLLIGLGDLFWVVGVLMLVL